LFGKECVLRTPLLNAVNHEITHGGSVIVRFVDISGINDPHG
jgi:hypothetical protein